MSKVRMHGKTVATFALLISVSFSLPQAFAQEAADAATLDAVVVTANKRVENVQDIPKSVMVVTPQTLSRSGVNTIRELGNAIPSISGAVPRERSSAPPIRGISSFAFSIAVQSQTGIVIDDISQPSFSSLFKELTDIERVEVLPGPQSTLSGRNASGGLINIVTRAPSDTFLAELSMEHTSDRQQRFNAFISGPLNDTLTFSVSAFSNEWEGHLRSWSETNGERPLRLDGWDTQGIRGKLRWQPTPGLSSTLTLYTVESTKLPPGSFTTGTYFSVAPSATHVLDGLRRRFSEMYPGLAPEKYSTWVESPRHGFYHTKDRGGSLHIEYELDNGSALTSITSIARADMPRRDNFVGIRYGAGPDITVPGPGYPYVHASYETESKSQEFRLTSSGDQIFDYLVGFNYTDLDTWHPYQRLGVLPLNWLRTFEMQSAALFARGTYHLSKRDALITGVRYQRDKMAYGWDFLPARVDATVPDTVVTGDSSYDFISTELSWRRTLTDGVNLYATVSHSQTGEVYDTEDNRKALQPGGLQPLESQKVRNIELGLKSQWWDRRLTFNANAFLAKYDNYHVQTREILDGAPIVQLFAIGKVETRGIEFESRLHASDHLNLNLNGAWIDAQIKDYPGAQCYPRQTVEEGCVNSIQVNNLAGNSMPNVPKFRLSGALSYFVPLEHMPFDLEFGTTYRWQSRTKFDYRGSPDPLLIQSGYGIMNVSATLLDREGRYSLSLFVNNLLDKQFYTNIVDDTLWTAPSYWGSFSRDSFRYSGVNLRIHF